MRLARWLYLRGLGVVVLVAVGSFWTQLDGLIGVLAFASPAPQACYEVYTAWKEDDQSLAELKQHRIAAPATRIAGQMGLPALKYAMELNGYYGGTARMPLLPLTAADRTEVEKLMADIRN